MDMQLYKHEAMLLSLLRASLNQEKVDQTLFEAATEEEWKACYKLAGEQQVLALAWDGVATLPKELLPSLSIKISWQLLVKEVERRYENQCHTIIELSHNFAHHGIRTLVLKGVGLSLLYPQPSHREGGDIDIYTYAADPSKMSDQEANLLADQLIRELGIKVDTDFYKDSAFTFHDIYVENHKYFLAAHDFQFAAIVDQLLKTNLQPLEAKLLPGKETILVPSHRFNTLFLAFHAVQHYSRGLCLRHLCDWVCLLRQGGLQIPKELTNPRHIDFIHTLTAFTNQYLGTHIPIEYTSKELDKLFIEIMRSPYVEHFPRTNRIAIFCYRIKRLISYRRALKEAIGEPLLSGVWSVFRRRMHRPSTMFRKAGE